MTKSRIAHAGTVKSRFGFILFVPHTTRPVGLNVDRQHSLEKIPTVGWECSKRWFGGLVHLYVYVIAKP